MRRFLLYLTLAPLFSTSFALAGAGQVAPAQRIVSLNICFDELLLKLVAPERIKSVYYLSANPQFSSVSAQAAHFHLHHGLAEEIVPLEPDLVIAGDFTSQELMALLKRLGLRLELLPLPRSLTEVAAHIRAFGRMTQTELAAEHMAQILEEKLVRLDAAPAHTLPTPAFWYSSNGVIAGADTLENELMTRAGFHNLALDRHISGFQSIDLEDLILAAPQVLIMEYADLQAFSLAQEYLQHPVLRHNNLQIIQLSTRLSCIAPVAATVIEDLIQARGLLHP